MATTPNSVISPQTVNPGTPQTFVNADTTTAKTVYTAGANGSVLRAIAACTTDTSANIVNITYQKAGSGSFYTIGAGTVPIASGTNGTAATYDLNNSTSMPQSSIDSAGNRVLVLGPGDVIQCAVQSSVTSGKTLTICASGMDL